jgi:hypothetical protein
MVYYGLDHLEQQIRIDPRFRTPRFGALAPGTMQAEGAGTCCSVCGIRIPRETVRCAKQM